MKDWSKLIEMLKNNSTSSLAAGQNRIRKEILKL